jgi:hypothetical protein
MKAIAMLWVSALKNTHRGNVPNDSAHARPSPTSASTLKYRLDLRPLAVDIVENATF